MNRNFFVIILLIIIIVYIISCQNDKLKEIPKIGHSLIIDTIKNPKMTFNGGSELQMVDIKLFNDSVFLFAIPNSQDTLSMLVFYWKNGFKYFYGKHFDELQKNELFSGGFKSMTLISPDTVVLLSEKKMNVYDFVKGKIIFSYSIDENISLLSRSSPIQWSSLQKMIYCEYIDWTKPRDSKGGVKTEAYLGLNFFENKITPLPLFIEFSQGALSMNAREHFTLTETGLILKLSYENSFRFYNFNSYNKNVYEIPYFDNIMNTGSYVDEESATLNYDKAKSLFMESYIQVGMAYDSKTKYTILCYICPVSERDESGKKPSLTDRELVFYIFNNDFSLLGEIKLDRKYFAYPTNFFVVNSEIFLVSAYSNYTTIINVKYEL